MFYTSRQGGYATGQAGEKSWLCGWSGAGLSHSLHSTSTRQGSLHSALIPVQEVFFSPQHSSTPVNSDWTHASVYLLHPLYLSISSPLPVYQLPLCVCVFLSPLSLSPTSPTCLSDSLSFSYLPPPVCPGHRGTHRSCPFSSSPARSHLTSC